MEPLLVWVIQRSDDFPKKQEKGVCHGSRVRGAPKSSLASPVIASARAPRSRTAPVAVAAGPPLPEPLCAAQAATYAAGGGILAQLVLVWA